MLMMLDGVQSKTFGWLMASQQKDLKLLDFSKPIRMLEFINVETNVTHRSL